MFKEFKAFILRGNVVDLAVGIVIGAAFGAIVNSFVKDILTPLLGLLNVPDFSGLAAEVGKDRILYGNFLNTIMSFLIIGAAIFFFVVKPLNRLMARGTEESKPANRECPHCLSSIPVEAGVCMYCTRSVTPRRRKTGTRARA